MCCDKHMPKSHTCTHKHTHAHTLSHIHMVNSLINTGTHTDTHALTVTHKHTHTQMWRLLCISHFKLTTFLLLITNTKYDILLNMYS